ncbi:MAG: protease, insulinase family/protease, insulinase family [Myxococcaceae bacterium]|nr:protease, insulinase family/protease, insulinase family [Myxococcaceae bacterium]
MKKLALAAALVTGAVLSATGPVARADGVKIPFTTEKLPNGMTVVLHEDHALPIVVVNVSYGVGSRYEAPKRTGFAHLFEHLMFMGTHRAPTKMFDAWMEAAGGWNNAWTSEDRTDYYDVGPPTALPLLLWLEADRLKDLGPLMTKEKLDAQREVVRNERRQTSENEPYGKVELRLPELLYPEGHPYHHPVIGSHEDLEAASVDDVKDFFSTWYDPANASLVVAGDFVPARAMEQIKKQLGSLPSRGKPQDPSATLATLSAGTVASALKDEPPTTLKKVVRETIEDHVELPKVVMAWQSPRHFAPGDAELDLLSTALTSGKASRLYKALVYEQKLAQSVEAVQASGMIGSRFIVGVIARPGVSLDRLEAAIDAELAKVRNTNLADEEMTRAKNSVETAFVARLESVRERASILNMYQAELGDPGYAENDLARYRKTTAELVRGTAARFLDPNARVIIRVIPKKAGAK